MFTSNSQLTVYKKYIQGLQIFGQYPLNQNVNISQVLVNWLNSLTSCIFITSGRQETFLIGQSSFFPRKVWIQSLSFYTFHIKPQLKILRTNILSDLIHFKPLKDALPVRIQKFTIVDQWFFMFVNNLLISTETYNTICVWFQRVRNNARHFFKELA